MILTTRARPAGLAELEAYHLRAVSAHGGDRGMPLPVPVPVPRDQVELTTLPAITDHRADAAD
jgi:hypothetical protein